MSTESKPPVVVLAGPTASGKSALALQLAEALGGEIVNADSMQVYRRLDVGTAKPSPAERARVPHHLLDVVEPDEQYSAGRYAEEARAAVSAISARGRVPFLVGGTGLYIRAFCEGLPAPVGKDEAVRARLEAEHAEAESAGDPRLLHRRLAQLDPASGARIHPNDLRRTLRALELHALTGKLPSDVRREHAPDRPYRVLYLVLDPGRAELVRRIDVRCAQMLERGLLQEVRELRELGYGPELPPMQAIGYRHMEPVIRGHETLVNVLAQMQHDTRQFARRQRTWFRAIEEAEWMRPDAEAEITARVKEFLAAEPRSNQEPV
jgi:tRNA dimethylallyltransferase